MQGYTDNRIMNFLPTSKKEIDALGWDYLDVILFNGDAYIDHPAFGIPLLGRVLQNAGYRVAIVPQPNWQDDLRDFKKLGEPRLFFGVSSGSMDSMVNHYTAAKRRRSDDAYTPDGAAGRRPDYAVTVYTKILKRLFPNTPVVIGGIEASLRRFTHYDYWSDSLMPSILVSSGADILVYGMGERPLLDIAQTLRDGGTIEDLHKLPQIGFIADSSFGGSNIADSKLSANNEILELLSFEECCKNKKSFAQHFHLVELEANIAQARTIVEKVGEKCVVINPPYPLMTTEMLDAIYDLPFTFMPHPRYKGKRIPAMDMIRFSVCLHRGCFGGCSFCTIAAHQGKRVTSRSEGSVLREIEAMKKLPEFRGVFSDLGGPTANMYGLGGKNTELCDKCRRRSCLFPQICKNLNTNHDRVLKLYEAVRKTEGVKHAFIGSGIRYDLFLDKDGFLDKSGERYLETLLRYHVSGRLKVAPEHTCDHVLQAMGKPSFELYKLLRKKFVEFNNRTGSKLQLIPYFISSHPACTEQDMGSLARTFSKEHIRVEQVQDFTPTPMTRSSVMFYSGINPETGERVFVERNIERKRRQKEYFFK